MLGDKNIVTPIKYKCEIISKNVGMNLESSPKASTPKCSQTAGQNCSLHEMKSSSRLKDKTRYVNRDTCFKSPLLD